MESNKTEFGFLCYHGLTSGFGQVTASQADSGLPGSQALPALPRLKCSFPRQLSDLSTLNQLHILWVPATSKNVEPLIQK